MGGIIPYTVNPAVSWNMTWPSGSFKQSFSNPQSHSIRVVSPSLPLLVTYHVCLHDSRLALTDLCLKPPSLMHADVITVGVFFYKEVLDSVLSVVFFFLFSQRTQQPATISTTTTRTLSPDTTPLMRTSEFSAERQHSWITWPSPFRTTILWLDWVIIGCILIRAW